MTLINFDDDYEPEPEREEVLPDGFSLDMTLREAKAMLRERQAAGDSVECPCCDQLAKRYRRTMLRVSALALVWAYRDHAYEPFHMPTLVQARIPELAHQGGAASMGAYWGFIEETANPRPDGGRAGWWRLTHEGRAYVEGRSFPKYAVTYNGNVQGLEGEPRNIASALGEGFDLSDLMSRRPDEPMAAL